MMSYFQGEWKPAWLLKFAKEKQEREAMARDVQTSETSRPFRACGPASSKKDGGYSFVLISCYPNPKP